MDNGNSGGFMSRFKTRHTLFYSFKAKKLVDQVYQESEGFNSELEKHSKEDQMALISASYAVIARHNPNIHFASAAAFIVPNIYTQVFRFKKMFSVPGGSSELERLTHGTKSVFREIFPALTVVALSMKYHFTAQEIMDELVPKLTSSSEHLSTGLEYQLKGHNKKARLAILHNEQTHTLPPILYRPWTLDYPKYLFSTLFFSQKLTFSATPSKPNDVLTVVDRTVDGGHLNLGKTSHRLIFGDMILNRVSKLLKHDTRYMYDEYEQIVEAGRRVNPELIAELERHMPPLSYEEFYSRIHDRGFKKLTVKIKELGWGTE